MLLQYYSIDSHKALQQFTNNYFPLVEIVMQQFSIDLESPEYIGDHLGLQTISSEEFDLVDQKLAAYSSVIHKGVIHNRRNNIYKFNKPLEHKNIKLPLIEIFEPKPDAEIKKLKPGIEHLAFISRNYDKLLEKIKAEGHSIDKEVDLNGSKFFKLSFVNLVEVEFRNDSLADIV